MKSKTSFFNKTVFKKNLTRFAPVMAVYTLCLILGMMMLYQNNEEMGRTFWFASRIAGNLQLMGLVNLLFAPLVAMLLFGDLYNSRMCNALHAMPMRRETLFLTNVVSGLLFSMIPTAVMALLSVPLLNATIVENAWQIALLWYVGTNLQFITFFGVAIFSVFCTGNRFAMAVVYAVLNGGAFILYYIINTLYTPMLFGVVTPDRWVSLLTPVADMTSGAYVAVEDFHQLSLRFYGRESEMVAAFSVDQGKFTSLLIYAAVGIVFAIVGLLLYRKRNLECAGDAIAFPILQPLFQLVCAVGVGTLVVMGVETFLAYRIGAGMSMLYLLLFCGGAAGWFGAKMLLKRTTRVFQLRSWVGLGILTAMVAVSLVATRFDVLGIEDRIPDVEDVSSVTLNFDGLELTDEENVLTSGIEIIVSPPGKVIKSLTALSGGEQSLVAIAIYFAILAHNPSPFCVLDEIEAALDDVNVNRYARYVHRISDRTQFIVITHRRGTMEAADVLYGVTMQEDGISKLLKLDIQNLSPSILN